MPIVQSIRDLIGGTRTPGNEVTRVARYIVLAETTGGFTIPDPGAGLPLSDHHFPGIKAPGVVSGIHAVIFYRTSHAGKPAFSVRLNNTRLTQHTFTEDGPRSWHEIIVPNALRAEANELTFAVSGDGSVTFSDVVILYTSDKLTIVKEPVLDPG